MEGDLGLTEAEILRDFEAALGFDADVLYDPGPEWHTIPELIEKLCADGKQVGRDRLVGMLRRAVADGRVEERRGVCRKTKRVVMMYRVVREESG